MNKLMEVSYRRCLLKDLTDSDIFNTIYEYIESLPKENRATPEIEKHRLDICLKCEYLVNGMCALCGCFVEVRAAKADSHCAQKNDIW